MSIPVVRAEDFYVPPPHMKPDAWDQVPAAERAFLWVSHRLQRTTMAPSGFVIGEAGFARINHNRWISDCPSCCSAQVVSPTDRRMACTECGLGWRTLTFPENPSAVEESLAHLPPHEKNWWHDEDPRRPDPPPEPAPEEPQPPQEPGPQAAAMEVS